MAVHGYVTHAAYNRRCTALLMLAYVVSFEVIGTFALTIYLLVADHEHTILSNPAGYAVRYALPIALATGLMFWWMYRGHAKAVMETLGVRLVSRQEEPRFVAIAEEQCTALGVRLPRFGVIEASEPNAVTVGEGPKAGLIAVTRGLLDQLDDDELAAVLAHEASHIRHGDTRLLAANHALMRTAVILQMNNPLRFEHWRQILVAVLVPPMLPLLLASSIATVTSLRLARAARRSLKLGRDHIADGEAIRVTHFPEALLSAIRKIGGRGMFHGSARVEGLLFDGPADHAGGSHPSIAERLDAIAALGRELMSPARRRRDSRVPSAPRFGRRPRSALSLYPLDASGRPLEKPAQPETNLLMLYLFDRETFRAWHNASIAWEERKLDERRNVIGVAPLVFVMLVIGSFGAVYSYWPKDGNLSTLVNLYSPASLVEMARITQSGPFCIGSSYRDGKCPARTAPAVPSEASQPASRGGDLSGTFGAPRTAGASDQPSAAVESRKSNSTPLWAWLFVLVAICVTNPSLIPRIIAQLAAHARLILRFVAASSAKADRFEGTDPASVAWPQHDAPTSRTFGRRKI
ncbi:M48 family metalloprotease [Bradyrhizobium sp. HKCCYLR20261]|uniref:M48 family metalloprotease n=1 Tax=Bradyrhizobium sp. HKCCYLR20261 TaxID=3420760 RepID=UPI003EC127BF